MEGPIAERAGEYTAAPIACDRHDPARRQAREAVVGYEPSAIEKNPDLLT
jgi:hypothetical protein